MKKAMYTLLMLGLFMVVGQLSKAQDDSLRYVNLAGQITDAKSGKILRGVKIYNETRDYGGLSKRNGFYTMVAVTGDIIRFSHVGYEPIYMRINQSASSKETVMVQMDENALYIEEVDVDANLPSVDDLNDAFMEVEVTDDLNRELAEQNPETFTILSEIETPPPGGPVSFLKTHVFDKIKEKKKKPGRAKKLPTYKKSGN